MTSARGYQDQCHSFFSLIFFPDVVNVIIEDGILHWELPNDLQQQVAAYHVLIYREGHRMEFPPVWVVGMSYNFSQWLRIL